MAGRMEATPGGSAARTATLPRRGAIAARLQTFSALRHRNYRLYWFGMLVAVTGLQVQMVAQAWLVYDITGSTALLGLTGLMQAVPTLALTLFGGVLADRVDRRRLIMFTQAASGLLLFLLATLTLTGTVEVWHIFAIAFCTGSISAFDQPARMALVPHLVEREDLMNAVAMGSMVWQSSRIVGPSLAGLLIGLFGVSACFYLTTIGMLVMVLALAAVRIPPVAPPERKPQMLRDLREGVGYVARSPIFSVLMGMTFFNSVFGMSYATMMAVFARDVLDSGSSGYGFLLGITGVGALIGTTTVASLGDVRSKGPMLLGGAFLFGLLIVLFSLSRIYALSLGLLFAMGAMNSIYMTTVNTQLQVLVPDELRGRVMSIYSMTWSLMPLGGFLSGALAARFADPSLGAPVAVGLGGALVALMAVAVALTVPRVRSL
jgi:MFS family permease